MINKLVLKHRKNEYGKCALCGKKEEIAHLIVKTRTTKYPTTVRAKVCTECFCSKIMEFLKNEK